MLGQMRLGKIGRLEKGQQIQVMREHCHLHIGDEMPIPTNAGSTLAVGVIDDIRPNGSGVTLFITVTVGETVS